MHKDESSADVAVGRRPLGPLPGVDAAVPVIDAQAIERLRELDPGGRQGVLRRVLRAYESSLTRHLAEIGSADTDADRLLRAVHALKSSSAAVGAMAFSQRCADIEQSVRADRTMPDAAQIQALLQDGRCVLAAVGAMLAP